MRPARHPSAWLRNTAAEAAPSTLEAVDAWLAAQPSDAEIDSWAEGEAVVAMLEARGLAVPSVPAHAARIGGLTELARLVLGALHEHERVYADPVVERLAERLGMTCLRTGRVLAIDAERITAALDELHTTGLALRISGGVRIRRQEAA